ncbi:MAG: glycosyltransferase [Omnitrophica WOR_2 bacterium]
MIRILYFTRDYTPHDHRFLTALADSGHKIYYLRLERGGHTLEDRPVPSQVEVVPWAGGQRSARLADGPRLLFDLKRVIKAINPDLIQAGPIQSAALLVALAGFHPLVSMSWGYDLLVDARRSRFWRRATEYALRHSDVMVGDCRTIREQAISYGIPDERIVTFPWGVDLASYQPPAAGFINSGETMNGELPPFTLLSTRGWEPLYGVEVIARAFVRAARERQELRLVMLGNGSQAPLLRRIFSEGGVLERVSFPGQVSQADLPRYYRSADLYISASHSDGTSISLLEAMACGRPVLVSDIPGNREWVTSGVEGWWFPDGDWQALSRAILNAADRREQLQQMGCAARALVEQRGDWNKNFPKLFEAYRLALHREEL